MSNATVRWTQKDFAVAEEVELTDWERTVVADGVIQVQAGSGDIYLPVDEISFAQVTYD